MLCQYCPLAEGSEIEYQIGIARVPEYKWCGGIWHSYWQKYKDAFSNSTVLGRATPPTALVWKNPWSTETKFNDLVWTGPYWELTSTSINNNAITRNVDARRPIYFSWQNEGTFSRGDFISGVYRFGTECPARYRSVDYMVEQLIEKKNQSSGVWNVPNSWMLNIARWRKTHPTQ